MWRQYPPVFYQNFWFRRLACEEKLAYIFIADNSTPAGFWKINVPELRELMGLQQFELNTFIDRVNRDYHPITEQKMVVPRLLMAEGHLLNKDHITYIYGDEDGLLDPRVREVRDALDELHEKNFLTAMTEEGFVRLKAPMESPVKTSFQIKDFCGLPLKSSNDEWFIDEPTLKEVYSAWGSIIDAHGVNLPSIFQEMRMWLVSNPQRRKTRRGIKAFAFRWLKRYFDDFKRKRETQEMERFTI